MGKPITIIIDPMETAGIEMHAENKKGDTLHELIRPGETVNVSAVDLGTRTIIRYLWNRADISRSGE